MAATRTDQIFEDIVETIREPLLVLDSDLKVILANRSFIDSFKVTREETLGNFIYDLGNKQWDIPRLRELLETILPQKSSFDNYEVEHDFTTIGKRTMLLNARRIEQAMGKERIILLAIEDITERAKSETLLRDSEERYRRLFETATDGILLLEKSKGKIVRANPAIKEILAYSNNEINGKDLKDIGFPHDMETIQEILQTLERDGIIHYKDISLKKKNGQFIYADIYMVDKAILVQCNIRDITDRKKADEALLHGERKYRTLVENANQAIFVAQDENLVFFNLKTIALTGYSDEELRSRPFIEFIHPDDREMVIDRHVRRLKGEELPHLYPFRVLHKDGSIMWGELNAVLINWDGKPATLNFLSDITERKQAEEALNDERSFLSAVLDNIEEAVVTCDREGRLLRFNEAARSLHGLPEQPIPPDQWADYYDLYRMDGTTPLPTEEIPLFRALKGERVQNAEIVVDPAHGGARSMVCSGQALTSEAGEVVGAVVAMHDITERKKAEEALRESEKKYRRIFENSVVGFFQSTPEGRFLDVNPAFARMLRYESPEDLVSSITDIATQYYANPRDRERYRKILLDQGHVESFEFKVRCKDRSEMWVSNSTRAYSDEDGKAVRYEGMVVDITDRKLAEEALLESEETHRRLFETMAQGVIYQAVDGAIISANPAAERILGLSFDQMRGKTSMDPPWRMIKEDGTEVPGTDHPVMVALRTGDTVGPVVRGVFHPDKNAYCWLSITAIPLYRPDENIPFQAYATFEDITERKEAQDALHKSRDRIEAIYAALDDAVFLVDPSTRQIIECNSATTNIFGYPYEEILGKDTRFMHVDQEHFEKFGREAIAAYADPGYYVTEFQMRRKDGSVFPTEHVVRPVLDSNAQVAYVVSVVRDITDRIRLQARLQQSHKMEAIGTLAGGIAHDFNNILSIIVGNTELAMLDVPEWSPAQDNLKEVREATLRARELVKQILMFARQKEQTVSNIRLEPIAKESLKMLRASIPTTVEILENIEEGLPPVLADPTQIQQIIMNLCTNAGQIMEAEGGTLTFTLDIAELKAPLHTVMEVLPPGRYVSMQVRDTGPGIPPENLERIFDPFFTTKGVGEGTGLGLAVVHGIVQERSGGIIVESEEGRGTTFTIYLPASKVKSVEVKAEQKTELPRGTERVLFVDDEPMIMKLGQHMLKRLGYVVEIRASGTDALECFRQDPHRFDVVVTDMTMPGMRGDSLAEEILAIRPDIPVILCTGYSRQISKEKAGEIGIRAFVMKPLTQHELVNTVRRVLDEKPKK